jgi:RNA polymerase sigma-70 factor, ECF subfamily
MDDLKQKQLKLEGLYNEYFRKIARYAYARVGDSSEAEDIASEVFIKALDSLKTYQERGLPMQAWLFKIAHNLVVDCLTRKSKRSVLPLDTVEVAEEDDPVRTAETNFELVRVKRAMQELTFDQQEVVTLRFFSGLSSKEVAEILNKKDGAVREMQSAALEKLRNILNADGSGS